MKRFLLLTVVVILAAASIGLAQQSAQATLRMPSGDKPIETIHQNLERNLLEGLSEGRQGVFRQQRPPATMRFEIESHGLSRNQNQDHSQDRRST